MTDTPMKTGNKKDLWHLVKLGILTQLHFDLETTGLERDFAQITAYGDALGDIAGNLIDSAEMKIRLPERHIPTMEAVAVVREGAEELTSPDRMPHSEAMSRIADRFNSAPAMLRQMGLPERMHDFRVIRTSQKNEPKVRTETIIEYPLTDDNGERVNHVRFHVESNKVAYRFDDNTRSPYYDNVKNNYYVDPDGSKWKLVDARVQGNGYRIKWADMPWLRTNLARAGFHPKNILFTHTKSTTSGRQSPKNYTVDTYTAVLNASLYGPEGEEGVKLGHKPGVNGQEGPVSAKLELVMDANTRRENHIRDIREGVRMPDDGSVYTPSKAHNSPAYDAKACFAIYNYCRDVAPDVIRDVEMQADEQYLRSILTGPDVRSPVPPIFAMMRPNFPHGATVDPVAYIRVDDQQGKFAKALMVRLDYDLRTYTYNGKKFADLNERDFADMIRKRDGLLRLEPIRNWKTVKPYREALATPACKDWDVSRIDKFEENYSFLKEREGSKLITAMLAAVENIHDAGHNQPPAANAMMEQEWTRNGFGNLDTLEPEARKQKFLLSQGVKRDRSGELNGFSILLYSRAMDVFNNFNMFDECLHRAFLQPHPVDYLDTDQALEDFRNICRNVKRKLEEKNYPLQGLFDDLLDKRSVGREIFRDFTVEEARAFRHKMQLRILSDELKLESDSKSKLKEGIVGYADLTRGKMLLLNPSRDFFVVDRKGRKLDIDYLDRHYSRNKNLVQKKFTSGEWSIQFYRLSSRPSVTAVLFRLDEQETLHEAGPVWEQRLAALDAYRLWGPPHVEASDAPWPTIPKLRDDIKKFEINARKCPDEGWARNASEAIDGLADTYLHTDESRRAVAEHSAYIEKLAAKYPLTKAFNMAARVDPESKMPYDYIEYEVPAKGAVVIDVPDMHIQKPVEDIRYAPLALVIRKLSEGAKKSIADGATVILRGEQTGRLYYPGPVDVKKAPEEQGTWADFYEISRRAYENESGAKFPGPRSRDVLVMQPPAPLAHTRRNIDPAMQSVKVPLLHFMGLVCPRLAHFDADKPFTGLLLPADAVHQKLETGKPIRFCETESTMEDRLNSRDKRDTGHIYESTLRKVRYVTVGALLQEINKKQFTDVMAQRHGFAGAHDMWEKINQTYVNINVPDSMKERLCLLEFDPVDKVSWAFWNPPEAPVAALSHDGKPVPPSAYRWYRQEATAAFNASALMDGLKDKAANDAAPKPERKRRKGAGPAP